MPRHSARAINPALTALGVYLLVASACSGCSLVVHHVGGAFRGAPSEMEGALSPGAHRLIEDAFEGIDPALLADYHVHILGLGRGGTGTFVHPSWRSWWHPLKHLQADVYLSAAGVTDDDTADREYVLRLVELIHSVGASSKRGWYHILALDKHYRENGSVDLELTSFYVSNEYVFALAAEFPEIFVPVVSVHPYRPDALRELDKWARRGCRHVKWLPNAMGIDPSSPRLEPFYRKMKQYGMILLSHTGEERAVDADDFQHLGNPLLLRKPLEMQVKVVAFHSASLGENEDLESPAREKVPGFDLLLRLLEEPRYDGLLFGEISSMTFYNHLSRPLLTLLEREDLHHRFVNGSDYPLPGINMLTRTRQLVREGFISKEERAYLNEIYEYNPLLFDFVVKRTVRHPLSGKRLPASVFMVPQELRPRALEGG